jgi:hypothetical protein
VFSVGSVPELYNEDPRPAQGVEGVQFYTGGCEEKSGQCGECD